MQPYASAINGILLLIIAATSLWYQHHAVVANFSEICVTTLTACMYIAMYIIHNVKIEFPGETPANIMAILNFYRTKLQ